MSSLWLRALLEVYPLPELCSFSHCFHFEVCVLSPPSLLLVASFLFSLISSYASFCSPLSVVDMSCNMRNMGLFGSLHGDSPQAQAQQAGEGTGIAFALDWPGQWVDLWGI